MRKRPPFNQNAAIRGAIRRTFSRSPVVREVLQAVRREVPKLNKDGTRSKKDAVQYRCGVCSSWVGSTRIAVDHIDPVIHPVHGFRDWNEFVARLFCSADNLQPICDECHQKKTNAERFARSYVQDCELIAELESGAGADLVERIKCGVKKFTRKRLEKYPVEFAERVEKLRARVGKKKKHGK